VQLLGFFFNAKCHSAIDHKIVWLCSDWSKMRIISHSMRSSRDYVLALILSLESSEWYKIFKHEIHA
jgi:hypothetical protein